MSNVEGAALAEAGTAAANAHIAIAPKAILPNISPTEQFQGYRTE